MAKAKKDNPRGKEPGAFEPYVPDHVVQPELTVRACLLGVLLAIVFGAANAYVGLKVGMTVAASIPAAVIGMAVLRGVLRTGTVLETNTVQNIGSAGESLAAGVIFTVPAMIILCREAGLAPPSSLKIFCLAITGGFLGTLSMIPLRRVLCVEEHGTLPYPEGTACAKVLIAGDQKGASALMVLVGLFSGFIYRSAMFVGKMGEQLRDEILFVVSPAKRLAVGLNLEASLLGVGFILGPEVAAFMLSGAVISALVLTPLIAYFGLGLAAPLAPAAVPIAELDAMGIWSKYIRYIGAGAVAFGGMLSLVRSLPMIGSSLVAAFRRSTGAADAARRTETDLPLQVVAGGILGCAILVLMVPYFGLGILGTVCLVMFSFLFTTVSARIVGLVGSSSNPASGMTIATLLATSFLFLQAGYEGTGGMLAAMTVGSVVCVGICIGGDTSQDLKTGFLVGATPWRQELAQLLGVLGSAAVVGWTLFVLDAAYPFGSPKGLAAPQANLMLLVVKGVMSGSLPWDLVGFGAALAAAVELLGIGCLPFAVGLYLPSGLSTTIMVGALMRMAFDAWLKGPDGEAKTEEGVLLASGIIAGEALVGVGGATWLAYTGRHVPELPTDPHGLSIGLFLVLLLPFLNLLFSSRRKPVKG